jgi:superfamily II DNA/RNA helicase
MSTEDKKKEDINEIDSWEDLNPRIELLRGIYSNGFEKPSPIQRKAIIPLFENKDLIAQAQSGTGKTACFSIGALQSVDTSIKSPQVIILSPTRELSIQTKKVIDSIGSLIPNLSTQLMIGGTSTDDSIRTLNNNPSHIIIGCPGRIQHMLKRKLLTNSKIKMLILDEADELLSFGFKDQVYNIFQFMPTSIQVALFSATMPNDLYILTQKFMRDPVKILVKSEQLTLEGIKQYYIAIENDKFKYETLKDIYSSLTVSQSIIYCNSVKRVNDLYIAMNSDNFPVCQLHSGMEKEERMLNYENFKNGTHRVLISTNVTSRGIDIQQVSTVINFDLPNCVHNYIHRIGRSGRWGRKGVGINFITPRDLNQMKYIEEYYHTKINELTEDWASQ